MTIYRKFYGLVCGLLANLQSYMHSGQNIAKIFTCVLYLTGLEKLAGAVLWSLSQRSDEEPLCQFIANFMVQFVDSGLLANPQSYMHSGQYMSKIFTCVLYLTRLEKLPGAVLWNVGRRSNEEPLCQFIGNCMV